MRLEFGLSQEEVLTILTAETKAFWGDERAEADRQAIANAAGSLWWLFQSPLDLTDEMPEEK